MCQKSCQTNLNLRDSLRASTLQDMVRLGTNVKLHFEPESNEIRDSLEMKEETQQCSRKFNVGEGYTG